MVYHAPPLQKSKETKGNVVTQPQSCPAATRDFTLCCVIDSGSTSALHHFTKWLRISCLAHIHCKIHTVAVTNIPIPCIPELRV